MSISWKDEQICQQFSLDEIKTATGNFDENLIIGKGGFGLVYIGSINNAAEVVAMKRLSLGSSQGETEFLREIETLSKLQHDHLVRLKGYCNESPEMILVYEYMPNGTLADHLYKKGDLGSTSADGDNQQSGLSWEKRLNICIGAARGLDYLHRESVPGIIHRDIKDSNILLDGNFVAKIADFGLAKLVKTSSESHTTIVSSTGVKGMFGYLDPEYFYSQRLEPAVDRKAAEDQRSLAKWSQNCIQKNKIDQIIDPYLAGKISSMSLKQFVKVTQKCLRRQSEQRPTMEEVVLGLELALKKQPTPGSSSKQSNGRSSLTQMLVKLQIVLPKRQPAIADTEKLCQRFSLYGIKTATQNFSEELIIGQGDLGTVYIGRLNSGSEVAIRKTNHGVTEFWRDFDLLFQLQHDHVISLKGYCNESTKLVLVYEHMSKATLKKHLCKLGDKQQARLTWEQLLHVCICAASGFNLLHRVREPESEHRPTMEEVVARLELALEFQLNSSPPTKGEYHQWSDFFDEDVYSSDLNDEYVNV
ncbi:hypothetical protein LIER_29983 [Lithospermum erythrorhizon]|uniref:non-specific serine/threonine protein kinase n=1 Tax=Lithospermum erythrorhizon TaxID=34254 RepID=A0AAV3RLF8_LITER